MNLSGVYVSLDRSGDFSPEAVNPDETAELVADLLANRPEAVAVASAWARAIATHRVWHFQAPEDIVQETLLAVLRNLRAGRYIPGDFRAYVRRIAKNQCVSSYRRHLTRGPHLPLAEEAGQIASVNDDSESVEDRLTVQQILARLGDACRHLITLAYFEKLSRRQIAERLGLSETAVKVRLFRCLERARELAHE